MPKFAFKRLIFGAVVKIFRGEAESGLKILMRFLVKISRFFVKFSSFFFKHSFEGSKFLAREGWGARFGRRGRKEFSKKCLKLCSRFFGSKIRFLHC